MKKKSIFGAVLMFAIVLVGVSVSAHGYIEYPESRAYLGSQGINEDVGLISYEPQSLEAEKGFPKAGPADGKIASAGIPNFSKLDEQTADRWSKVDVPTGKVDFSWTLTARHRTSGWHYYITKKGWNPDKPLSRDEFELLTYIKADGTMPNKSRVKQTINIPNDREGYYVILGVWDIADTNNAFYQIIDANIVNSGEKSEVPTEKVVIDSKASDTDGLEKDELNSNALKNSILNNDKWYIMK